MKTIDVLGPLSLSHHPLGQSNISHTTGIYGFGFRFGLMSNKSCFNLSLQSFFISLPFVQFVLAVAAIQNSPVRGKQMFKINNNSNNINNSHGYDDNITDYNRNSDSTYKIRSVNVNIVWGDPFYRIARNDLKSFFFLSSFSSSSVSYVRLNVCWLLGNGW